MKEIILNEIKCRIISEYSKHSDLDWPEIIARKLYSYIEQLQRNAFEAGRENSHHIIEGFYNWDYDTFEDYLKNLQNGTTEKN